MEAIYTLRNYVDDLGALYNSLDFVHINMIVCSQTEHPRIHTVRYYIAPGQQVYKTVYVIELLMPNMTKQQCAESLSDRDRFRVFDTRVEAEDYMKKFERICNDLKGI